MTAKTRNDLEGQKLALRLWQDQADICPICHQKITQTSGRHNHHILWQADQWRQRQNRKSGVTPSYLVTTTGGPLTPEQAEQLRQSARRTPS